MEYSSNAGGLAVFVKTPGVSPVKTRLAAQLGKEAALQFYNASLAATAAAVAELGRHLPDLQTYWAVAEASAMETAIWAKMPNLFQGEGDLGARLDRVYRQLVARHGFACVMGADSPQLTVGQLVEAVTRSASLAKTGFVIGETLDGGFYFFGSGREISPEVWTSIEYSCATTGASLVHQLRKQAPVSFLDPSFDVDRAEDLDLLAATAPHGLLPEQLRLLEWARTLVKNQV